MNKYRWLSEISIVSLSLLLIGCTGVNTPTPPKETLSLPAITKSATDKHYSGKFVWHDLLTDDITKAKAFYGGLLGWRFEDMNHYSTIYNDGKLIGGMMEVAAKTGSASEAVWLPSMSVKGIENAVKYVERKGGKVLKGPLDMQERGKGVLISDPHGAHIVLLQAKGGDPLDATPRIGDWLWNELWSKYPKESDAFYRKLGHYDSSISREDYLILIHKGEWRAGIRHVVRDDIDEHWVPVIRVDNPQKLLSKVEKLGGKVLMKPDQSLMNGDVAVIADNSGAHLILQRWSEGKK
ncbi:MAG: VOC family protein [Campylobacterota bacterium]|nr:VOC family protein [Campylobacterota bacterium]